MKRNHYPVLLLLLLAALILCGCTNKANRESEATIVAPAPAETTENPQPAADPTPETVPIPQKVKVTETSTAEPTEETAATDETADAETEKPDANAAEDTTEEETAAGMEAEAPGLPAAVENAEDLTAEPGEENALPEAGYPDFEEPQVELTVPARYADVTYRVGEVIRNMDNSVTYLLTEEEHERLLEQIHGEIQEELDTLCDSAYFFHFDSITANQDCTVFAIVVNSTETTRPEQEVIPLIYELGWRYAVYQGREPGNVHIDYMTQNGNTFVMRDSDRDLRDHLISAP